MNISYEPNFSMEKFNNDNRIQNLVNICLDNNYGQVFDLTDSAWTFAIFVFLVSLIKLSEL